MYFNLNGGVFNHGNYIHTSNKETHAQVDLMNKRNFHFNNNSCKIYIKKLWLPFVQQHASDIVHGNMAKLHS
jgi:hypothetical protein